MIALVFTALNSPYSVEILRGVTSSPMDVVVSSMPDPSDSRPWSTGLASAGRSGAIIFASSLNPLDQHILDHAHVPYVLIDPDAKCQSLASPPCGPAGALGGAASARAWSPADRRDR